MKNTRYIFLAAAALCTVGAYAQSNSGSNAMTDDERGLIETVAKIEKKTDKFNLFLNMHGSFNLDWTGSHFNEGLFKMQQLRIEARGHLNEWLSYRYRQRLNKGDNQEGYRDNILNSIDVAGFGLHFGKWDFFLGKQCASYGGIEFDLNPIEVYEYSDIGEHMIAFMSGVNVAYNFTPRQQLQFQVLNAYNTTSRDMYGDYEKSKLPLIYTLNWNGNFNDFYKTRWSASVMSETKGRNLYYFALGNEFNFSEKVGAYFDWMYSIEGVDRKGIVSNIVAGDARSRNTAKVDYMSFVFHVNYRFLPQWNLFGKFMYDTAGIYKTHEATVDTSNGDGVDVTPVTLNKGNYKTSYGYVGGIEYYPFKDRNLHFFACYIGRDYHYSTKAKAFGAKNSSTNELSVGFIWHMPIF